MGMNKGGGKDQSSGTFATGFLSGLSGGMLGSGGMAGGMLGSLFPQLMQQQQWMNIGESLNQQYGRPSPDMQGPMPPLSGVSLRNKLIGGFRQIGE